MPVASLSPDGLDATVHAGCAREALWECSLKPWEHGESRCFVNSAVAARSGFSAVKVEIPVIVTPL